MAHRGLIATIYITIILLVKPILLQRSELCGFTFEEQSEECAFSGQDYLPWRGQKYEENGFGKEKMFFWFFGGSKSFANLTQILICFRFVQICFREKREANRKQILICIRFVQICFREKRGSKSKANLDLYQICPDLFPRKKGSKSKANRKQILICIRFVQICFREKGKQIESKSSFVSDLSRFVSEKKREANRKQILICFR